MTTSPLSPEEFHAAAEVYRELGPAYREAVAESFMAKINTEIAAQVDAQLARTARESRAATRPRRPAITQAVTGALLIGFPLVAVLMVMHGSAAVRADWYQWLLGTLVVTVLLTVVVTTTRKMHIRLRPAKSAGASTD